MCSCLRCVKNKPALFRRQPNQGWPNVCSAAVNLKRLAGSGLLNAIIFKLGLLPIQPDLDKFLEPPPPRFR